MQDSIRSKLDLSYIRPQFLYPLNPPGQFSLNGLTSAYNLEQGADVDGQATIAATHRRVQAGNAAGNTGAQEHHGEAQLAIQNGEFI